MYETLKTFMDRVGTGQIEIYNEFSFQHELGIFLREKCAKDYKVQFKRNTSFFGISSLVKKEIDLVVFNENEKYAIELKHPLNGQYPEQMFSFVKDIRFMEQLAEAGFTATYCLVLVKDKSFYSGAAQDGIYSYFRGQKPIHGEIHKPTGEQKEEIFIDIHGNYIIRWLPCGDMKYFLVEISA